MIEEEDGFLGGGNDDELIWVDCGVDGGKDFAEPGGARGFGVAAPVLEEGVVGAGFEGEKFFDGEGFGVGGGEKKFGGKFVFAHVFFNAKGSNLHGESVAARAKCVERQIGWETEGKKSLHFSFLGTQKRTGRTTIELVEMMATAQKAMVPAWHVRLINDLNTSDESAKRLVAGLSEEQLNWQPAAECWSVGQCLEHLCITNEAYLPAISAALKEKADAPVEQIVPGWFGGWFLRNFIEPSPQGKRAPAPGKIRPTAHVGFSVLDRFLSGNQACRDLVVRASRKDVNRIRFWNPLVKGIRFTVGTGFSIIAGHERRHLLQAECVVNSSSFPR